MASAFANDCGAEAGPDWGSGSRKTGTTLRPLEQPSALCIASSRTWERSPKKETCTHSRSAPAVKGRLPTAEPSEADAAIGKLEVEIAIPLHKIANNLSKK